MKKNLSIIIILFVVLVLSACQNPVADATPTESNEVLPPTEAITPTNVTLPTETLMPEKVVLYTPAEGSITDTRAAQEWLSNWSAENGYLFEIKTQLSSEEISDENRVVVLFGESGVDAKSLAEQHPNTTFVDIRNGVMEGQPANMITLVADSNYLNFAAGYLSILIAPDWRLGALLPWDEAESGAETLEAFTNGTAYHCGRCASTYMPVVLFPVTSSLPSTSVPETWMGEILTLDNVNYLYTVYVAPEAASEQLYQQLVTQNVTVVGAVQPENIEGLLWAASINQDITSALIENWDAIINSTLAENEIIVPVVLTEVNEEYLSIGRIRLYDEMMDALMNGWVSPLSPEYP